MRKTISFLLLLVMALYSTGAHAYSPAYERIMAKNVVVTRVKLNATKATIVNHYNVTDTYKLIATVTPANANDTSLNWSSSNESVAVVSQDGLVTAVGEGTAVITAAANDRGGVVKANCTVKVKATRVSAFSLGASIIYMDHSTDENTATIGHSLTPSNATFQSVKWTSSNESVARVDEDTGLITALSQGKATITATVDAGRKKATCEVVVRDKSAMNTVTICAIGDLVLGGDPDHNDGLNRFDSFLTDNGAHDPDYSYNLKNAKALFDSCDLTVANLEVALTNKTRPARAKSSYNFRGKPAYANILVQGGVDVVSIANNHTSDFGSGGVSDTKTALNAAGVSFAGDGKIAYENVNGARVAVIGIMTQSGNAQYALRRAVREASGADIIVVLMHCAELTMYDNRIRQSQINNAKAAIDAGADMVVCAHPAVFSGIGVYKGKYIYFDMGTFIGSGLNTCVLNYAVTQTFRVGTVGGEKIVECDIPTIYPGHSSGYSRVLSDTHNNCQPVLFKDIDTAYARAMSNRVASTVKTLSSKLTGQVKAAEFNVG
ncbi:MAG: CapA family protein [Clostridia bacterium]|nr:CapA family protein [Clostridia bacterium]